MAGSETNAAAGLATPPEEHESQQEHAKSPTILEEEAQETETGVETNGTRASRPLPRLQAPGEWPSKLHLEKMPQELLLMVLDHITRPTDLKSLCLTSPFLRRLATPPLYRSIILFVGGPKDKKLSAFLKPSNPGIPHVREIFLRLEKFVTPMRGSTYGDESSDEEDQVEDAAVPARQAQFTVRLLLDHLPADQLESFSWQNWEPQDVDNFELLCQTQKNLRSLEIGPMDRNLDPILAKKPDIFTELTKVTSVDVFPDNLDRLHAAHRLLKAKPDMERLTISAGFEYSPEGPPPDLDDSSTRPGLLTRTLFSHMLPFESCTPYRRLKFVELDSVDLRYCADSWCRVIQFTNLDTLEIRNCAGVEMFWAQISKPHQRPLSLKTLRWMDAEEGEDPALDAFDNFIESISGLKTLHVLVSKMSRLPRVTSITAHRHTLESLSVHSQKDRVTMTYSEAEYEQLCRECNGLRQLSINFPKTAADYSTVSSEFSSFLDTTFTKLPHLRTLNIRRWPVHRDSFSGSTISQAIPTYRLYEMHLQRLSQQIFEKSDMEATKGGFGHGHRSNLSLVCWGGNGRSRHDASDKYKLKQIPFARGVKTDAFGETSMLAVQTIWR